MLKDKYLKAASRDARATCITGREGVGRARQQNLERLGLGRPPHPPWIHYLTPAHKALCYDGSGCQN